MGRTTDDPSDPGLMHGADPEGSRVPQAEVYLILSKEERSKGFVRPLRRAYRHVECGAVTTMSLPLAETYARSPGFYGATYCVACGRHAPVSEFRWDGTDEVVGT